VVTKQKLNAAAKEQLHKEFAIFGVCFGPTEKDRTLA